MKQVLAGTVLILSGVGLMAYSVWALSEVPYVYLPVLLWVTFLVGMVGRDWVQDIRDVFTTWRTEP